jgi:hypothetical protein
MEQTRRELIEVINQKVDNYCDLTQWDKECEDIREELSCMSSEEVKRLKLFLGKKLEMEYLTR